jgi:hypothetical protein
MRRFVAKYQNIKYAPEYLSQQYGRYEEALRTLENQFGRHPTHKEIADYLGSSEKAVARIEKAIAPETNIGALPEEMGDELTFNTMIASKQQDDLAYLRSELQGDERKAFDLIAGWGGRRPIVDLDQIAKRLKLDINDIYKMRRNWTKRLKGAQSW